MVKQLNWVGTRLINPTSFYILFSLLLCASCYGIEAEPPPIPTATEVQPTATQRATITPIATPTVTPASTLEPTPVAIESEPEIISAGRIPSRNKAPVSPLATPDQSRRLTLDGQATTVPTPTKRATNNVDIVKPLDNTTNILLLGSDRRPESKNWRTDVIMVIALDLAQDRAGVISIPRDLYLEEIPLDAVDANRINVVDYLGEQDHPGGGPEALAQIIDEYMDIAIDYYLRFEFDSFQKAIDILDGIEIYINCPSSYYVTSETEDDWILELSSGSHRLNGSEALAYVRSRDTLRGDLDRARRQQQLAWAVRNQVLQENLLPRVPALYAILAPSIQTDIGIAETVKFAGFALELNAQSIHGLVITPPDLLQERIRDEMFIFVPNWDAISSAVQTIFERPPFEQTNTISMDNGGCP